MYMLDTNICIYAIKGKSPRLIRKLLSTEPDQICISAITYAELMHGVKKSDYPDKNEAALNTWLSEMKIIDFDSFAALEYGKIRSELERKGTPIGPLDTLLAAHALSEGCVFVTHNVREFKRIPELIVEDWFS